MNRIKQLLLFSPFLFAAALIIVWFYVLNIGTADIKTNVDGSTVLVEKDSYPCPGKKCLLKLKTGSHTLIIRRDGYHPATKIIDVKRNETFVVNIVLIKIAQLVAVDQSPAPMPKIPAAVFFDTKDNRVKINKDGVAKNITTLFNLDSPVAFYESPDGEWVIGQNEESLYLINIPKGSREKIQLPEAALNINWLPGSQGAIFNDQKNDSFFIGLEGRVENLGASINLSEIIWIDDQRLVYLTTAGGAQSISAFDISSRTTEKLVEKTDSPIDDMRWDQSQKAAFFHGAANGKWYRLEL